MVKISAGTAPDDGFPPPPIFHRFPVLQPGAGKGEWERRLFRAERGGAFLRGEFAPMARRQVAEFERTDGEAAERRHPGAEGGHHPADLPLLPLAEREEIPALRERFDGEGAEAFSGVADAGNETRAGLRRQRLAGRRTA